jgi:hypothetical protein
MVTQDRGRCIRIEVHEIALPVARKGNLKHTKDSLAINDEYAAPVDDVYSSCVRS